LPGVTNLFDFTPTAAGVFRGQCTQYCGLYHSEMLFNVRVTSSQTFTTWLAHEQTTQAGQVPALPTTGAAS
jgi:cytochrome c oxidase subunit II